jgi:hypothetical protein
MRQKLILSAALFMAAVPVAAQLARKAPPDVEEALRARVRQFYSLFQEAKFRQAESLVAEDSRDAFYNMSKVPIRGFRIERLDFADDFKSATVLVSYVTVMPRMTVSEVYIPVTSRWKLIDGQWFLGLELPKTTPFGSMHFEPPKAAGEQPAQRATLETVTKGAFEVAPQRLVFPRQGPQAVTRTVAVKNHLPGTLALEVEGADLPGLAISLRDRNIPPKSQVSFDLTYDPAVGKLTGTKQITVRVKPLEQTAVIQLQFE